MNIVHRPTTPGEKVRVFNPESNDYDLYGYWTGETGQFNEHFEIECGDKTRRLHYEDIKPADDNQ